MTTEVSYPGDNEAGALLASAMTLQWTQAENLVDAAKQYTTAAITSSLETVPSTVPSMVPASVAGGVTLPTAPKLALDYDTAERLYNLTEAQILDLLKESFVSFIGTYFPREDLYESMLDWCQQVVVQGGSGISVDVERQLWERDRSRINAEMGRALADAEELWANRGFPIPPGALVHQQNQIRIAAAQQLSESSRTAAVKSWDAELENIRMAVKTVIDHRQQALAAARDYIMALAQAPQIAQQLASSFAGLRNQVAQSLVGLYTAQVNALDPKVRVAITDAQLAQAAAEANQRASLQIIDEKVKAVLSAAELCGRIAAASVNAVSAQVGFSGRAE